MSEQQLEIIVQAGGRGTRLRHHTWNKPKCLVSVKGSPILYHLFDRFRGANFTIISDYMSDTLSDYLNINKPNITYKIIKTSNKGTLAGIQEALKTVPEQSPLLIAWSDILLKDELRLIFKSKPVVILTDSFICRWSIGDSGLLEEKASSKNGVSGLFYFPRKSMLPEPPSSGEFVAWYSKQIRDYECTTFNELEEIGDFTKLEQENERDGFCRFFNKVDIDSDTQIVTKTVVDKKYNTLHEHEVQWYNEVSSLGFRRIPKVYSISPLVMQKINGVHAYDCGNYSDREKKAILANYFDTLEALHSKQSRPAITSSIRSVYLEKTTERVSTISKLVPKFTERSFTINGKKCRNIFAENSGVTLENVCKYLEVDSFAPIHGDPTFSNSLIDDRLRVWLIDPRGSFGAPGIYGDVWYDYAKVYYSAVGCYDLFNRRKFKLYVDDHTVEILMEPSAFSGFAEDIFEEHFGKEITRIRLIHGLIWLSLSGYVRDDIDSIIGSFFLGLYWLEEGITSL